MLVFLVFIFMGCAGQERRAEYKAVRDEIIVVASQVNTLMPNAKDWCEAESACQYLRNIKCGGATGQECVDALKRDTVKLGGDTVVIQSINEYIGVKGRMLVYGQAFNCNNKFTQLGMRYQAVNPTRLKRVRYINAEYAKKCDIKKNCKFIQPFECRSNDYNPARKCISDLDKRFPDFGAVNSLVFKQEKFTVERDNGGRQAGDYILSGDGYHCKL